MSKFRKSTLLESEQAADNAPEMVYKSGNLFYSTYKTKCALERRVGIESKMKVHFASSNRTVLSYASTNIMEKNFQNLNQRISVKNKDIKCCASDLIQSLAPQLDNLGQHRVLYGERIQNDNTFIFYKTQNENDMKLVLQLLAATSSLLKLRIQLLANLRVMFQRSTRDMVSHLWKKQLENTITFYNILMDHLASAMKTDSLIPIATNYFISNKILSVTGLIDMLLFDRVNCKLSLVAFITNNVDNSDENQMKQYRKVLLCQIHRILMSLNGVFIDKMFLVTFNSQTREVESKIASHIEYLNRCQSLSNLDDVLNAYSMSVVEIPTSLYFEEATCFIENRCSALLAYDGEENFVIDRQRLQQLVNDEGLRSLFAQAKSNTMQKRTLMYPDTCFPINTVANTLYSMPFGPEVGSRDKASRIAGTEEGSQMEDIDSESENNVAITDDSDSTNHNDENNVDISMRLDEARTTSQHIANADKQLDSLLKQKLNLKHGRCDEFQFFFEDCVDVPVRSMKHYLFNKHPNRDLASTKRNSVSRRLSVGRVSERALRRLHSGLAVRNRLIHREENLLQILAHDGLTDNDLLSSCGIHIDLASHVDVSTNLIDTLFGMSYQVDLIVHNGDEISFLMIEYMQTGKEEVSMSSAMMLYCLALKRFIERNCDNQIIDVVVALFDSDKMTYLKSQRVVECDDALVIVKNVESELAKAAIQVISSRNHDRTKESTRSKRSVHINKLDAFMQPRSLSQHRILDYAPEFRMKQIAVFLDNCFSGSAGEALDSESLDLHAAIAQQQVMMNSFVSERYSQPLIRVEEETEELLIDSYELIHKLFQIVRVQKKQPSLGGNLIEILKDRLYRLKFNVIAQCDLSHFNGNASCKQLAITLGVDFENIIVDYVSLKSTMMSKGFRIAESNVNFHSKLLKLFVGCYMLFINEEGDLALVNMWNRSVSKNFKLKNTKHRGGIGIYSSALIRSNKAVDVELLNMQLAARLLKFGIGKGRINKLIVFTNNNRILSCRGAVIDHCSHEVIEALCHWRKQGMEDEGKKTITEFYQSFKNESRMDSTQARMELHPQSSISNSDSRDSGEEEEDDDEEIRASVDIKVQTIRCKMSVDKLHPNLGDRRETVVKRMEFLHDVGTRLMSSLSHFLIGFVTKMHATQGRVGIADAMLNRQFIAALGSMLYNSRARPTPLITKNVKDTYASLFRTQQPLYQIDEKLVAALRSSLAYSYDAMLKEIHEMLKPRGMLLACKSYLRAKYRNLIKEDAHILGSYILKTSSSSGFEAFPEEKLDEPRWKQLKCSHDIAKRIVNLEVNIFQKFVLQGSTITLRFLMLEFVEIANMQRKEKSQEELKVFSILPMYKFKKRFITLDKSVMHGICKASIENWDRPVESSKLHDFFPFKSTKEREMSPTALFNGKVLHVHHEMVVKFNQVIIGGKRKRQDGDEDGRALDYEPPDMAQVVSVRGTDPGNNNVFVTAWADDDGLMNFETLSKGEYDMHSGRAMLRRSIKDAEDYGGMTYKNAINELSQHTFKTASWEGILQACHTSMETSQEILQTMYPSWLQNRRFTAATFRDSYHKKLLDKLTCNKTVAVALGNGSRFSGFRGVSNGAPHVTIKRMAKRLRYPIFAVNEAYTSKRSFCCASYNMQNHRMKSVDTPDPFDPGIKCRKLVPNKKDEKGKIKTIYGLQYCTCCRLTWSRDNTGASNIWRLARGVVARAQRNPIYSDSFSETSASRTPVGFIHDFIDRFS